MTAGNTATDGGLKALKRDLRAAASREKAAVLRRFFRTGPGGYAEGDVFIGVTVPRQRAIAQRHSILAFTDLAVLLRSPIHEERMTALLILTYRAARADAEDRRRILDFYLTHLDAVNNWDLVDLSADKIVGAALDGHAGDALARMARSRNMWERRIAMVATFHFIKQHRADEALRVARLLLHDEHDLIHKAVGWMLREVGKRCSRDTLESFLKPRYRSMPRTMLRYAIERLPDERRAAYLAGAV